MIIDEKLIQNKKGIIVIGSARSGSHFLTDALFRQCTKLDKILLGEIYKSWDRRHILKNLNEIKANTNFVFASIVQFVPKNLLIQHRHEFADYYIVNLRRRDKIAQYASWCLARSTWKESISHSPIWELVKKELPFTSTDDDIDQFIIEQNFDYIWPADCTIYYEDLLSLNLSSKFKKNELLGTYVDIFSNYGVVKERLDKFKYYND